MKKLVKALAMLAALALVLTGCNAAGEEPRKKNLTIVVNATANAPRYDLAAARDLICAACRAGGQVSLIVEDGDPFSSGVIEIPEVTNRTESTLTRLANQHTAEITAALGALTARTSEADTLAAIIQAGRALSVGDGEKELVIFSPGISTAGYLNFTGAPISDHSPDRLLAHLQAEEALPDLEGVNVTWFNLGDSAGAQAELSQKDRKRLQSIWEAVLTQCGAAVTFKAHPPLADGQRSELPVTPVPVGTTQALEVIPQADQPSAEPDPEVLVTLDAQGKVQFLANTAAFRDEGAAIEALEEVLESVGPDTRLLLAGTTARRGEKEGCRRLSLRRAEAVSRLLVRLGVEEDRIICLGMGFESRFHEPDVQSEAAADRNRAVIILDADSALAQQVLLEAELGGLV